MGPRAFRNTENALQRCNLVRMDVRQNPLCRCELLQSSLTNPCLKPLSWTDELIKSLSPKPCRLFLTCSCMKSFRALRGRLATATAKSLCGPCSLLARVLCCQPYSASPCLHRLAVATARSLRGRRKLLP